MDFVDSIEQEIQKYLHCPRSPYLIFYLGRFHSKLTHEWLLGLKVEYQLLQSLLISPGWNNYMYL